MPILLSCEKIMPLNSPPSRQCSVGKKLFHQNHMNHEGGVGPHTNPPPHWSPSHTPPLAETIQNIMQIRMLHNLHVHFKTMQ